MISTYAPTNASGGTFEMRSQCNESCGSAPVVVEAVSPNEKWGTRESAEEKAKTYGRVKA